MELMINACFIIINSEFNKCLFSELPDSPETLKIQELFGFVNLLTQYNFNNVIFTAVNK